MTHVPVGTIQCRYAVPWCPKNAERRRPTEVLWCQDTTDPLKEMFLQPSTTCRPWICDVAHPRVAASRRP